MSSKVELFLDIINVENIKKEIDSIIRKKKFDSLTCTFDSVELIETECSEYELPQTELIGNFFVTAFKNDKLVIDRIIKINLITEKTNYLNEMQWLGLMDSFTVTSFTEEQKTLLLEGFEYEKAFKDSFNVLVNNSKKALRDVYRKAQEKTILT